MARICIITVSSLYATPRVVKEADALAAAGHQVRVVFAQAGGLFSRPHDLEIMNSAAWACDVVTYDPARWTGRLWWKLCGLRQKLCRVLIGLRLSFVGVAERAAGRLHPELMKLAGMQSADLFIAHYPGALGAAAGAARKHRALLGYDLEDCYFIQHDPGSSARRVIETVERRYLGFISHLSTATRLIGVAFRQQYGREPDVEVRNCFDPIGASVLQLDHLKHNLPRGFWFSQVISMRRGLDTVLQALARCTHPLTLDLRGSCDPQNRIALEQMIDQLELNDRVRILPPVAPKQLIFEATNYDIGFAAEVSDDPNRPLTASNKLFTFLAAGLAIAATNQPGQVEALKGTGDAARFYAVGETNALAQILDDWCRQPELLAMARQDAYSAAHGAWGWKAEATKLTRSIHGVLSLAKQSTLAEDLRF